MDRKLRELIESEVIEGQVKYNEPMKNHTTFRIGGMADCIVFPGSIEEAEKLIRLLCINKIPFTILGNGSNVLVTDKGIRDVVICFSNGTDEITVDGNIITAGAGAMLSLISKTAHSEELAGLEFASGIPGSLGGAVFMNAGAYGGEMKDVVEDVTLFDMDKLEIVTLTASEMDFSYRHSIAKEKPYVILSARLKLKKGNAEEIKSMMDDFNGRRRDKQPLEYPSAGSTFKRPEGYFAGKLIEDAGLRGYSVGGARVSTKHCGFVVNEGDASAEDVLTLIEDVQNKVYDQFKVMLEPEILVLGEK